MAVSDSTADQGSWPSIFLIYAIGVFGAAPMKILWIYAGVQVTRTFADSGKTVEHLSTEDLMGIEPPK